ncbi:type I restriction-modification system S subunit, putative [Campylobacter upsaliensis RM3195]|uniref:restriction endonuclease subunit S n=1 Tax=Campylobacter upsaliensis TaxID=28080 RepID=UPI00004B302E|nr:restriction endonuclease subunit S [Campylobacter upsaliensis]EAL52407.1 type I restriction-modification system S subunit, putative [Campylobacter upsaliensis RM3195]
MKTDTLKKSLLDYAIKGSLTAKFRRENNGLNAFDELEIYNDKIKQKHKNLEKELKKCEKEFKLEKDKEQKALFKSQIQMLKKELIKCKEITPLNSTEAPFTIPNSWAWVKLGDICEIISGTSYSKDDLSDEGIRILRGGNINKNSHNIDLFADDVIIKQDLTNKEKQILKNDILMIASTGSKEIIGKSAFSDVALENTQIGAFLRIIRISKEQNAKYIFHNLISQIFATHIKSCAGGTNILNIKNEYIENFLIPLPPLCEQQEIVKKLDLLVTLANDFAITKENLKRIEKRIEKSLLKLALEGSLSKLYRRSSPTLCAFNEINTYNEAIKQKHKNLEKELKKCEKEFKLEKDKEQKALFKSQIQMLKKELIKCKEITPLNSTEAPFTIPNSWAWVKLGDICEIISGEIIDLQEENLPLLDVKYLRSKGDKKLANSGNFANANDRLILMDGENSGEIFITKEKGFLGSTLKKLEFSSLSQVEFMDFMLLCYKDFFKGNKKGAAIPHLDRKLFANLLIPLPPLKEQEHIVQILDTLFTLKKGLRVD